LLNDERAAVATLQQMLASHETNLGLLTEEITAQRKERDRLMALYRTLAEHFPRGVVGVFDRDCCYELVEGQMLRDYGIEPQSLIGQIVGDTIGEPIQSQLLAAIQAALEGQPGEMTYEDQGVIYHTRIVPVPNNGAIERGLLVTTDVTAQVHAERKLRESEERFRRVFLANPAAKVIIRAADGVMIDANPAFERLSGYDYQMLIGQTTQSLHLSISAETEAQIHTRMLQNGRLDEFEMRMQMQNGYQYDLLLSIVPVDLNGIAAHLCVILDLTARKQAEAALRSSEERYRLITENASDLIELLDIGSDGVIVYASPSHQTIYGHPASYYLGRRAIEVAHAEDNQLAQQIWQNVQRYGKADGTLRILHADGSYRWIEISIRQLHQHGNDLAISVGRDVTERQKLQQQYLQAQKMESIGRLAGGIAHDFNNLLTAILGTAELARLDADGQMRIDLDDIIKAAHRAAQLTRQLLTFARQQVMELRVLDLNTLILDVSRMLTRLIDADIELVMVLSPNPVMISADPSQIEQVLVNLVVNARDSMPQGGKLTIETEHIFLDESYLHQRPYIQPGEYIRLTVTDTGTGMTEEVQAHLFEPFFTTKERGKGTGLGLATVYGIIKQHHGNVWIYSEAGVGTSIKAYFPQVDVAIHSNRITDDIPIPVGNETILLAEDEEQVRAFTVRVLTSLGYTVYQAANGEEALALAVDLTKTITIDLLISDVIMPHMGGSVLASKFATLFPHTRFLFISGYTDNTMVHAGLLDPNISFLQKPFSVTGLAQKVRQVLDSDR
jgi:PAS domain S-box-containing protein